MGNDISRILIVDDDSVDRIAVRRALKKATLELEPVEVTSATDAIAQLTANYSGADSPFTWALLDYQLPDLDGLALVRQLRQQDVQIPLIVLTGQGDEQIAVDMMKAGASDYLVKDQLSPQVLERRLRNTLRIYEAEQQAVKAQIALEHTNALLRQKNQALEQQRLQIEQVNRELLQANQAKSVMMQQRDDFVARLTHDLRTPLIAANRMLKFCHEGTFGFVAGEVKEAIGNVINSNQHLLHMVNSLLDVYRHEAGQKQLTYCPCNLLSITTEVVKELQVLALAKNLICAIVEPPIGEQLPSQEKKQFQIEADPLEVRRVLTNLIGNAIKFTDRGSVRVFVHCHQSIPSACVNVIDASAQDDSNANGDGSSDSHDNTTDDNSEQNREQIEGVSVGVKDTGVGIAPEDQALVFDQFRQGQTLRSGSGLGLHLAQRIARLHGGLITVESSPGQGSTFTLYLPIKPIELSGN